MNSSPRPRRIAAHYMLYRRKLIRWGVVSFDAEGTVTDVDSDPAVDKRAGVEFYDGILIPGMVNAHTHLELSYMKGGIAPGGGFAAFAAGMREVREKFPPAQRVAAAGFWDAKMYGEGVSLVGDISNSGLTLDIKKKSGIRYRTFLELYGLGSNGASHLIPLKNAFARESLPAGITPHSTYSLNEMAFRESLGDDPGLPLSLHFMESPGEAELFRGGGPLRRWYDAEGLRCDFTDIYNSPAERIIKNIEPGRELMLVHNTFIGESEVMMLKNHFGERLTFVLCPLSNLYISGILPPVELLRSHEMRIAVGTDSLASNTSLSVIDELKALGDVPLEESLVWVTAGGAAALGAEGVYGSFEPGSRPGAAVVSGVDLGQMKLTPRSVARRVV